MPGPCAAFPSVTAGCWVGGGAGRTRTGWKLATSVACGSFTQHVREMSLSLTTEITMLLLWIRCASEGPGPSPAGLILRLVPSEGGAVVCGVQECGSVLGSRCTLRDDFRGEPSRQAEKHPWTPFRGCVMWGHLPLWGRGVTGTTRCQLLSSNHLRASWSGSGPGRFSVT